LAPVIVPKTKKNITKDLIRSNFAQR